MDLTTKIAIAIQSRLNTFLTTRAQSIRDEEWAEQLEGALTDFPENRRAMVTAVLENQIQYIKNTATADRFAMPSFSTTDQEQMLFNIAKYYLGELDVHHIVGVQPMKGPVGLSWAMRYRYEKQEESEEPTVSPFTNGKIIKLEVITHPIEAGSRKWSGFIPIETMQDAQNHIGGLDLKKELAVAIGSELAYETTKEVMNDLVTMAQHSRTYEWKQTDIDAPSEDVVYVSDQVQNFLIRINMVASEIARVTRRGAGNFIVASPLIVSLLQAQKSMLFVPNKTDEFRSFIVGHAGNLCSSPEGSPIYKVYNTLCLPESSDAGETVLVGYKGPNEVDTGYVFAPYVPVMTKGVVIDPKTLQPGLRLMTRYGKTTFNSPSHDPFFPENGASFYGKVILKGLSFA
ncbi:MAG: hypothetical protein E4H14_06215 [Candidatus Thorarchaeota archaeon]|nr:MAG: hypothetical protein E4H14_06215 [Candidatus Thorarchaeota archaeon]